MPSFVNGPSPRVNLIHASVLSFIVDWSIAAAADIRSVSRVVEKKKKKEKKKKRHKSRRTLVRFGGRQEATVCLESLREPRFAFALGQPSQPSHSANWVVRTEQPGAWSSTGSTSRESRPFSSAILARLGRSHYIPRHSYIIIIM